MTEICTVPPAVLAVKIDAAKAALRIDCDDLDALVTIWTEGVIGDLEHEIGQCLMEQTWEVRLAAFPGVSCWQLGQPAPGAVAAPISLPHPVMTVTTVKYLDLDGVEQTMDAAAYRLNVARYTSTLTPARGGSWPATAEDDAAVKITLQCGYGNDPVSTPKNVQLYILAKLAEQFDPVTRTERNTVQSTFIDGLLDRCRSYA